MFILIGDTHGNNIHELNQILPEFSSIVQDIFEHTAPLMTIPPAFAQKYKLKTWTKFENSVVKTLEIANKIVDIGIKINGNGLLKEMQANKMSTEIIRRIFIDLIIAAGDTVSLHKGIQCMLLIILLSSFIYHRPHTQPNGPSSY